jgi:hypothetical protein
MFDSEPEPSKIRGAAEKLFRVAREHRSFVPAGEDPEVVARAVRYIAQVHALPYHRDDTSWFHQTLTVLLELAHPSERLSSEAGDFLRDLEAGIRKSRDQLLKAYGH